MLFKTFIFFSLNPSIETILQNNFNRRKSQHNGDRGFIFGWITSIQVDVWYQVKGHRGHKTLICFSKALSSKPVLSDEMKAGSSALFS